MNIPFTPTALLPTPDIGWRVSCDGWDTSCGGWDTPCGSWDTPCGGWDGWDTRWGTTSDGWGPSKCYYYIWHSTYINQNIIAKPDVLYISLSTVVLNSRDRHENLWLLKFFTPLN